MGSSVVYLFDNYLLICHIKLCRIWQPETRRLSGCRVLSTPPEDSETQEYVAAPIGHHVTQITPQPVDTGRPLWYTENMKKKTQPTEAEKKSKDPGSWPGAIVYATVGTLIFCAVAGVIDALSPSPTGLDSLWLCFAVAVVMFLILLMAYWITVSYLKGGLLIGISTKVALIFPSLLVAGIVLPLLLGNTNETKPCPITIAIDCRDGECVKTYNGHRVIKEYTLRAVDFAAEPEYNFFKNRLVLTAEDSNGNTATIKTDFTPAINTVLEGEYTGKQVVSGVEGGVQKVYIIEPNGDKSNGEDQPQQDKSCRRDTLEL